MPETSIDDFTFTSKSQTQEEMAAAIKDLGLEPGETEVQTDAPAPAAEPPAAEAAPPEPAAAAPPVEAPAPAAEDPEKLSRRQRAIARAKAEMDGLKAENARLAKEFEEFRQQSNKPAPAKPAETPAPVAAAPSAAAKPNPDNFASGVVDPDYIEALADWKFDERERQRTVQQQQTTAQAETDKRIKAEADAKAIADAETASAKQRWDSSVTAAKAEYPDWDTVMQTVNPNIPKPMVACVLDRDKSAHLAYYLTSHPEEEKKLAGLAMLPEKHTEGQWRKAYAKIDRELDRIEEELGLNTPAEPDEDPSAATPAPQPTASHAAAPAPAKPAPKPKPTPPATVGSRGAPNVRSLKDLPPEELRKIDPLSDEYRRAVGML